MKYILLGVLVSCLIFGGVYLALTLKQNITHTTSLQSPTMLE